VWVSALAGFLWSDAEMSVSTDDPDARRLEQTDDYSDDSHNDFLSSISSRGLSLL
jgi:hypothetical protein